MTCKNCIHFEVCGDWFNYRFPKECTNYCDKARIIPLPFVVGDTVWCVSQKLGSGAITNGEYEVVEARVTSFEIYSWSKKDSNYWMTYKTDKFRYLFDHGYYNFCSEDIGKFVFATKEEAEAKAKEMGEQHNG